MPKLYVCDHCLSLLKKQKNIRFTILKYKSKMACALCRHQEPQHTQTQHVIEFDDKYLSLILHKTKFVSERALRIIDKLEETIERLNDMIAAFPVDFANQFFETIKKRYAEELYKKNQIKT